MFDDYLYDSPADVIEYKLEDEDTYEELARSFDTSVEAIAALNPQLNMAQVTPGENIRVPVRPRFCENGTVYVVRRGDTLREIAARFGTTVDAILRANPGLNPNRLTVGQQICIPVTRPQPGSCPGGFFYTIVAGDTIFSIAARFGTTVGAILRANPGLTPNRLFVGQQICIPVPRPQPGTCPGGFFYTIVAGDTLFSIASRFGTTVDAILRANPGLDPNRLFVGQQICIPVPRPQPGVCPGGFFYTIVAGDTLFSIASRFGTTVDAILRANPGLDPNRLFVGQQICIPVPRPQPGCPGGFFYTVMAGDTLNSIAFRFRVSVDAIIRANPGINPDFIVVGQQLCIPRT